GDGVQTRGEAARWVDDRDLRAGADAQHWREGAGRHRRTTKGPRSDAEASSAGGWSVTSTPVTRAAGGPGRHHSTNASPCPPAPPGRASTSPLGRFRIHPLSPCPEATSRALSRKKTP